MKVLKPLGWSQGVGLLVRFLGHKKGIWSKLAAHETMIQA